MAINEWWAGDPSERYWVEITDRSDLGSDLFAPTANQAGKPYWGYELITLVQPGDIVLHWHKSLFGEPGFVGWSIATGIVEDTDIEWQARGSRGRLTGNLNTRPAWRMPLTDYTPFTGPVMLSEVRGVESELRAVLAELESVHTGSLYFPFAFGESQPARATQTYFAKVPRRMVEELEIEDVLPAPMPRVSKPRKGQLAPATGSGYIADPKVRKAVEMRAVELAIIWYDRPGRVIEYTGDGEPYDLRVMEDEIETRVEVKGTSGLADRVILTKNEVANAKSHNPTDLFVVEGIQFVREADGSVLGYGGECLVFEDWTPTDADLVATQFRYTLSPNSARSVNPS